jgi:hypothetical protein
LETRRRDRATGVDGGDGANEFPVQNGPHEAPQPSVQMRHVALELPEPEGRLADAPARDPNTASFDV